MSAEAECRVYWGSHGCGRPRGHTEPHECGFMNGLTGEFVSCCECEDHERDHEAEGCVAKPPYYGTFDPSYPNQGLFGEDFEQEGFADGAGI